MFQKSFLVKGLNSKLEKFGFKIRSPPFIPLPPNNQLRDYLGCAGNFLYEYAGFQKYSYPQLIPAFSLGSITLVLVLNCWLNDTITSD